jgi:TfoX/Sxy family transcriptional regulator of competence genes
MAAQPKWTKSPSELINLFHAVLPKDPSVEPRKMFGFDCAFVNGNMFSGLHQADLMLRLPEAEREALLALPGARPFEPVEGRPMREYVVVPASMHADRRALARWMAKALRYGASLPRKQKAAATPKSSKRKAAATKPPPGKRAR